jgi:transcriptional regulator with XRE-family HTH domain
MGDGMMTGGYRRLGSESGENVMRDVRQVSSTRGIRALTSAYAVHVANGDGGRRFGDLLRQYREALELRQEDVVELVRQQAAGEDFSLATYSRWERGHVINPKPDDVVAVCKVLRLSTVAAGAALGYLAPTDIEHLPEPPRPLNARVEEILAILEDPDMPDDVVDAALQVIRVLRANTRRGDANEQRRAAS